MPTLTSGKLSSSLDPRFDRHLAKPHNIRSLFLAINDEVLESERQQSLLLDV
jgi:phosphatidylinositol kinase/protein kinase (PI-3  family)